MKLTPVFVELVHPSNPLVVVGLINVAMLGTVAMPRNPFVGPTPAQTVQGEIAHIKMGYHEFHRLVGLNPGEGEPELKSELAKPQ